MRISDWRSDVCSSDLRGGGRRVAARLGKEAFGRHVDDEGAQDVAELQGRMAGKVNVVAVDAGLLAGDRGGDGAKHRAVRVIQPLAARRSLARRGGRSEEHTSELQSLMRISYAVFCL